MGLLVDFSPDGMMDNDDGEDDNELEAEFMAIVGGQPNLKGKPKGKSKWCPALHTRSICSVAVYLPLRGPD